MNYLDEAVTKNLDEFMEYYKVIDTEEIYSNGTEFVPIFRVKQWEEYNNKDKEIDRLNSKVEELMTLYTTEREVKEDYKSIIKEVREKLLCYGETFDLKVHQEMQKELLKILDEEKV